MTEPVQPLAWPLFARQIDVIDRNNAVIDAMLGRPIPTDEPDEDEPEGR